MYKLLVSLGSTLALAMFLFATGVPPASAHDFDWVIGDLPCIGAACLQQNDHADTDPYAGWANLTLTNTGTEDWGDLHFQIFETSGGSVENVDFVGSGPNQPTSDRSDLTWVVDNLIVGATIDLYFYDDPVGPGETATFSVYTDNSADSLSFFGLQFFPTPVPEPGTVVLVAAGLVGLAIRERRPRA